MQYKSLLLVAGFIAKQALALTAGKNVALYWGQNSYGDQGPLGDYCDSDDFDIVIVSFVTNFSPLELNLANQCGNTFPSGLLNCAAVGDDITKCQLKGKKVLLSLGGGAGNYGFQNDEEAANFASVLWNKFGGGSDDERPFGTAVVDGFDFDFEKQNQVGTVALANTLRSFFNADSSKLYSLSASPQCVYPDSSMGNLMSAVPLDYAFIQFYNNECSLDGSFNWNQWSDFAKSAPNSDIQLFVGLPGAAKSASTGFVDLATVESKVDDSVLSSCNFGGFLLWDASSATNNVNLAGLNFYQQLKNYLVLFTGTRCPVSSSSSSTSASSTASSSSSTSTTSTSASSTTSSSASTSTTSSTTSSSASTSTTASTTSTTSSSSTTSSTTSVSSIVSSPFYPLVNLTGADTASIDESTVVKTTVLEVIYTTVCPEENGGVKTIVTTNYKTVTYTGECECTKVPAPVTTTENTTTTTKGGQTATTTTTCDTTTEKSVATTTTEGGKEAVPSVAEQSTVVTAGPEEAVPSVAEQNAVVTAGPEEAETVIITIVTSISTSVSGAASYVPQVTTLVTVSTSTPAPLVLSTYEFAGGSAKVGTSLFAVLMIALAQLM